MAVVGPSLQDKVVVWMRADQVIKVVEGVSEAEVQEIQKAILRWFQTRVLWGGIEGSIFIKVFYHLSKGLLGSCNNIKP
jgi:hypothetical protein